MYDNTIKIKHGYPAAAVSKGSRRTDGLFPRYDLQSRTARRPQERRTDRNEPQILPTRRCERMAARHVTDRIIDAINRSAERFQAGEFPISGRAALIVCSLFVALFLASAFGWWFA